MGANVVVEPATVVAAAAASLLCCWWCAAGRDRRNRAGLAPNEASARRC